MTTETVWHKVKKLHWITNKHGKVVPYLQFTKAYKIENEMYDGISLYPHTIAEKGIGRGSQIKLKHNDGFMLDVLEVRYPKAQPENLWCKTCLMEIENYECVNPDCEAKGHTPIVKLMKWAFPMDSETAVKILTPYLNNFPIDGHGTPVPVNDLIDFLQCVNPKMNPRTPLREGILKNYESGSIIHQFECQIFDWFTVDDHLKLRMPSEAFWDVVSLQGLSTRDYRILESVNPVQFKAGKGSLVLMLQKQGFSKKAINILLTAHDAIAQVVSYAKFN